MPKENFQTHNQAPEGDNQQLTELYPLYVQFQKDLCADGIPELPIRSFPEFVTWWEELANHVRQKCENDFRTGYQQLLNNPSQQQNPESTGN